MIETPVLSSSKKSFSWDFYSLLFFSVVLLFQIFSWYRFPLFLDDYYHLSVMQGFVQAGGWVGEAFWEYAPVGRAHLYPPFWHLLECGLGFAGLSLIAIARISNIIIYPFFLAVGWFIVRKRTTAVLAFWTLFFLISSESLYVAVINNIPFSLAFCFGLLAFYACVRKRLAAASVCLAASFYTHALVPWLFFAGFLIWGVLEKGERRGIWKTCLFSLLLSLPFLIHEFRFFSFVRLVKPLDYYYFSLDPLLLFLSFVGIGVSVRKTGLFRFFLLLTVVFCLLAVTHRSRFLSGHGVFFFAFFAAAAVAELGKTWRPKFALIALAAMVLFFQVLGLNVTWNPEARKVSCVWLNTPLVYWLGGRDTSHAGIKAETIYYPKWIGQCVEMVKKHSSPGDILYSNYDYAGGMVAVLSARATSTAMLPEVRPFKPFDQVGSAQWILWFKDENPDSIGIRDALVSSYGLRKAGETDIAFLFFNTGAVQKSRVKPAVVPFFVCILVIFGAVAVIVYESRFVKPLKI